MISETSPEYNLLWDLFRSHASPKDTARVVACRLKGMGFDYLMFYGAPNGLAFSVYMMCEGCEKRSCIVSVGARDIHVLRILKKVDQGQTYHRKNMLQGQTYHRERSELEDYAEGLKRYMAISGVVTDEFAKTEGFGSV